MGINAHDFRTYIVAPACELLAAKASVPNPPFAADLLVATCAQETGLGTWLHQTGVGDAISIWQFEPATLRDLWTNFIQGTPRYAAAIAACAVPGIDELDQVIWNLRLGAVLARLYYYRVKEPLPAGPTTLQGLWHYYKTYYNTVAGAATLSSFQAALKLTDLRL